MRGQRQARRRWRPKRRGRSHVGVATLAGGQWGMLPSRVMGRLAGQTGKQPDSMATLARLPSGPDWDFKCPLFVTFVASLFLANS